MRHWTRQRPGLQTGTGKSLPRPHPASSSTLSDSVHSIKIGVILSINPRLRKSRIMTPACWAIGLYPRYSSPPHLVSSSVEALHPVRSWNKGGGSSDINAFVRGHNFRLVSRIDRRVGPGGAYRFGLPSPFQSCMIHSLKAAKARLLRNREPKNPAGGNNTCGCQWLMYILSSLYLRQKYPAGPIM